MVMHDNENKTTENENWTKDKIEQQHNLYKRWLCPPPPPPDQNSTVLEPFSSEIGNRLFGLLVRNGLDKVFPFWPKGTDVRVS